MSDKIHVQRVSPFGTDEWRAVRGDGELLFEIRLQISSMLNGSRYFVFSPRGDVVRHGTFNLGALGVWSYPEIVEALTAIITAVVPGSEVDVKIDPLRQASGT